MSTRFERKYIWPIEGTIQDIWYDLKYKWEARNDCLECNGDGKELADIIEGWSRYEFCGWCDGSGKMTITRRLEWLWYYKIKPVFDKILKRVVPIKIQFAYEKRLNEKYEKAWKEEYQAMKGECQE